MLSSGREEEVTGGRFAAIARTLLFSRAYTVFVIVQIILNLALFIWEVATVAGLSLPDHWLFAVLEIWVNLALVLEVILRLVATASLREYLRNKTNWFDLAVLFCSVVALILLFSGSNLIETLAGEATLILLAVRYVIVLLRVVLLIKGQGRTLTTSLERVEFVSAVPLRDDEKVSFARSGASPPVSRNTEEATHKANYSMASAYQDEDAPEDGGEEGQVIDF